MLTGGVPVATQALEQQWDFIFFTGSPPVGRIVYEAAAKHLTPVALELGGKNPTVVHKSADLRVAARRIAYGRYINAGQVCTAPDYVLIWPEVKEAFIGELKNAIAQFYGPNPQASPDYGRIINQKQFERLVGYLQDGEVVVGGQSDEQDLYIAPTVLVDPSPDSPVMTQEIFGPILPIREIGSVEETIEWIGDRPHPLGLYIFTGQPAVAEEILARTSSGGVCINDCAVQPMIDDLPFGGVGESGLGKYHGRFGFETFSHARAVYDHSTRVDPDLKYPPYSKRKKAREVAHSLL